MSEEKYENLSQSVDQIESSNEFEQIELKNNLRLKLESQARRRIILIWLPIVGLVVIFIIWLFANIPNYNKCYEGCIKKSGGVTVQSKDDCEFFCKIKYQ